MSNLNSHIDEELLRELITMRDRQEKKLDEMSAHFQVPTDKDLERPANSEYELQYVLDYVTSQEMADAEDIADAIFSLEAQKKRGKKKKPNKNY